MHFAVNNAFYKIFSKKVLT